MRVPLVYSNPKLYPKPLSTDALVSHVDFLPTLASLVGGAESAPRRTGRASTTPTLVLQPHDRQAGRTTSSSPTTTSSPGQTSPPYPKAAEPHRQHPRGRWKLAKYYDVEHETRRRSGRCTTSKTDPLEQDEPRLSPATSAPRARRSSSGGSSASSPGSSGPACSRFSPGADSGVAGRSVADDPGHPLRILQLRVVAEIGQLRHRRRRGGARAGRPAPRRWPPGRAAPRRGCRPRGQSLIAPCQRSACSIRSSM